MYGKNDTILMIGNTIISSTGNDYLIVTDITKVKDRSVLMYNIGNSIKLKYNNIIR